MNFKVDENLPSELVADLQALGHDAQTVHDEGLSGAPDTLIMEHVLAERRVLLTLDRGIGDIRSYPPDVYAGIVLFRPASTGRGTVLTFVRRHLEAVLAAEISGRLVVVSERNIRIR